MLHYERLHLKDFYPHLAENGRDPFVDIYLPYNMREMKRQDDKRPSMVICPGGGYGGCSEREWEPLALKVMAMGFNAFVIRYSTAPHRYPTGLIEVAALYDLINKNADEWNCDVEKISIMGFSAGGHLAAHYSNAYNLPEIKELYGGVSAQCWMRDDYGWRYRLSDGSWLRSCIRAVDGISYSFDSNGYATAQ